MSDFRSSRDKGGDALSSQAGRALTPQAQPEVRIEGTDNCKMCRTNVKVAKERIAELEAELKRSEDQNKRLRETSMLNQLNALREKYGELEAKLKAAESSRDQFKRFWEDEAKYRRECDEAISASLGAEWHEVTEEYIARIEEIKAERDRYRAALERIAPLGKLKHSGIEASEIAREALAGEGETK